MKYRSLFWTLFIISMSWGSGSSLAAPVEEPTIHTLSAAEIDEERLGRVIRDTVALPLEEINPDESWVVARLTPDAKSPIAEGVGFYWDSRTQKMVQTGERMYTRITEWGVLEPLVVLSGSTPVPPTYKVQYEDNPRLSRERYSLFSGTTSRTVVLRISEGTDGTNLFHPAYLLADEWVPFVQSALKYMQENKAIFDAKSVGDHLPQLNQLISAPNPLLEIAAVRLLSDANQLQGPFVRGPMTQAKGLELAIFTFLYTRQPPIFPIAGHPIPDEMPMESLRKFIESRNDVETLKALATGLRAVMSAPESNHPWSPRADELLERVNSQLRTLGIPANH